MLHIESDTPRENFARGLLQVDIPGYGDPIRGKVRDNWVIDQADPEYRVMVTTDRQSAFDSIVCTIPGKGQVLNLLSAYWFAQTKDIIANHMIHVPHPNVLLAHQAKSKLLVEVVLRRYMARSSTATSIYYNYADLGRREIYGLNFPEGLKPNEEFPMGTIITPTTKADTGHDAELTDNQAAEMVDGKLGDGIWSQAKTAALAIFERARLDCLDKGLILVDTKYEFGLDRHGQLILIDEIHTPDSSRFWLVESYLDRFNHGKTPETFDKEILRRWLADQGFKGEGRVPVVNPKIIDQMAQAYVIPFRMITGKDLPYQKMSPEERKQMEDPNFIGWAIASFVTPYILMNS